MATVFQTPVALITLITEDRVWFKVGAVAPARWLLLAAACPA